MIYPGEPIKYLFLDGATFDIRIYGSVEKVPVLVAIGVPKNQARSSNARFMPACILHADRGVKPYRKSA
ncbi:MAG: hypothetical protein R6T98_04265 [Desulfatiglandales bacterium]